MDTLLQDLRYAIRMLARHPGFTAIAVFTLAVGIGANTAIYSVVDATLLRTLPFRDPGRLMRVSLVRSEEHTSELQSRVDISYAVFCLKKNRTAAPYSSPSVSRSPRGIRHASTTS